MKDGENRDFPTGYAGGGKEERASECLLVCLFVSGSGSSTYIYTYIHTYVRRKKPS